MENNQNLLRNFSLDPTQKLQNIYNISKLNFRKFSEKIKQTYMKNLSKLFSKNKETSLGYNKVDYSSHNKLLGNLRPIPLAMQSGILILFHVIDTHGRLNYLPRNKFFRTNYIVAFNPIGYFVKFYFLDMALGLRYLRAKWKDEPEGKYKIFFTEFLSGLLLGCFVPYSGIVGKILYGMNIFGQKTMSFNVILWGTSWGVFFTSTANLHKHPEVSNIFYYATKYFLAYFSSFLGTVYLYFIYNTWNAFVSPIKNLEMVYQNLTNKPEMSFLQKRHIFRFLFLQTRFPVFANAVTLVLFDETLNKI